MFYVALPSDFLFSKYNFLIGAEIFIKKYFLTD